MSSAMHRPDAATAMKTPARSSDRLQRSQQAFQEWRRKMPSINFCRSFCFVFLLTFAVLRVSGQTSQPPQPSQQTARPANRCEAPEYKQLDFILGSWEVSNKGKKSADVTFEPTSTSNCGLSETWHNANGGGGSGLFANSPVGHGWEYFWVPSSGQPTWLHDGKPTGNGEEMQFTLTRTQPDGSSHVSHWTLTKMPDGQIRELSVNTEDGKTEYELMWTKK